MDILKFSLNLFLGIYILNDIVESEMIANNTFTISDTTPLGDGVWQASATCHTAFPGKTYGPGEAYMFARFGVPVANYQDYLGGNWVEMGPNNTWLISSISYGSSGFSLTYSFLFDFDVWLGSGVPSGDCHQFTSLQEARDFAGDAPTLSDTPEDTFIASAPFVIGSASESNVQGTCDFNFPGITIGQREAFVLVDFKVPITYKSDYIGNIVLYAAEDSTWYISRGSFAYEDTMSYKVNFLFKTSDTEMSGAVCSLYVSENDAVTASSLLSQTTSATNGVSTTTDPAIVTVNTNTVPITTTVPLPATHVTPVIIPPTPSSNKTSEYLFEYQEMRDKYFSDNNLWKKTTSLLRCGRLCITDDSCVSVFYQEASSECTAHKLVYGHGQDLPGVLYYVVK